MNIFEKKNQILYISLQSLIFRPVVMIFPIFFFMFSWKIFLLILNWWCICYICGITKIIRSYLIMNWWTVNITIFLNWTHHRTSMYRSGFKMQCFSDFIKTWHWFHTFKVDWVLRKNIFWRFILSTVFDWRIFRLNINKWE